jgi:cyclophilin family peptidyl-prolyl cis-trans isomerase
MYIMIDDGKPSIIFESRTDGNNQLPAILSTALKFNRGSLRCRKIKTENVANDERNVTTKESLLWFQSLKKHWLNSPRTPIQPILPIPTILSTESSDPIMTTLTTTKTPSTLNNDIGKIAFHDKSLTREETQSDSVKLCASNVKNDISNLIHNDIPSTTVSATTTPTSNTYRERLIQFYCQFNPDKLKTIDTTLQKYLNREEELFQILHDRYCRYLPIPTNINPHRPIVFLEFEYHHNNNSSGYDDLQEKPLRQRGMVHIQLFHDVTPYTAENFRCLCTGEKGCINRSTTKLCYINTYIHRIVHNMCLQGGDITTGDGTGGRSIYASSLRNHPKTDLWGNFMDETFMTHSEPGLLSMANNGKDRNSSQFFITIRSLPHLNGKHVVFGRVISGMDIINDITHHTLTDPHTQRPLPNYSVKIVDCGEIQHNTNYRTTSTTTIRASARLDSNSKNDRDKHRDTTNTDVRSTGPIEMGNVDRGSTGQSETETGSGSAADVESTGWSDMGQVTRYDPIPWNYAIPISSSSFHEMPTTLRNSANADLISEVKINDDCDGNHDAIEMGNIDMGSTGQSETSSGSAAEVGSTDWSDKGQATQSDPITWN